MADHLPSRNPPRETAEETEPPDRVSMQTFIDRTHVEPPPAGGPPAKGRVIGTLEPGTRIGHYMVVERIGAGAMGVVYAAFDPRLDRKVALKLLRPAGHRVDVERAKQRLMREAQALAKLKHPNVVTVHDVGTYLDQIFVAMEYIDGPTLGEWLKQAPSPATVLEVFIAAGEGLQAAHAAGLVHRDFKPDNVMLDEQRRPRVMDFGLARSPQELEDEHLTAGGSPARPASGDALSTPLTQTGALMGTPAYMSPEQHMGLLADARSDQFSYCVALYEALYGQRPFQGRNIAQLGVAVTTGNFAELPRDRKIPNWLRTVVLKGLSTSPPDRYADIAALLDALRDDPSRRRQRWLGVGVAVALMGTISVGAYKLAVGDQQTCEGGAAQIARSWDPAKRESLALAFEATGRAWAATSAAQIAGEFDRFSTGWAGVHRDACLATRVRGERSEALLDRQMVCLDRAQRDFDALLGELLNADSQTVDAAVKASTELPSIHACADLEALERGVAPPRAEIAAQVDAARGELSLARAARLTGHLKSARTHLAKAAPQDIDYPPFAAEHALESGSVARFGGDFEASARHLERAYGLAIEHRDDNIAARAAAELVYVKGYRLAQTQAGAAWALQARHWTSRVDPGGPLEALALHNNGVLLDAAGDSPGAEPLYRQALQLRQEAFGDQHPMVGRSIHNLGNVYLDKGDYPAARSHYQRAIDIYGHSYGNMHPIVAGSLNNLGLTYRRERNFEPALEALTRAVEIYEGAFGAQHPDVALSLDNVGLALIGAGRYDEAEARIQRGLRMRVQLLGDQHPDVGDSWCSMARLELARGQPEAARAAAERALPLYLEAFGEAHFQVATAKHLIGLATLDAGRPAEALPFLGDADATRRKVTSAPWERAETAAALSLALQRLGRAQEAEVARTRALADFALAGPSLAPEAAAFERDFAAAIQADATR